MSSQTIKEVKNLNENNRWSLANVMIILAADKYRTISVGKCDYDYNKNIYSMYKTYICIVLKQNKLCELSHCRNHEQCPLAPFKLAFDKVANLLFIIVCPFCTVMLVSYNLQYRNIPP